jgi:hypothetical protein
MRDYIENWLKKALIKITETYQEMVVTTMVKESQQRRIKKEH